MSVSRPDRIITPAALAVPAQLIVVEKLRTRALHELHNPAPRDGIRSPTKRSRADIQRNETRRDLHIAARWVGRTNRATRAIFFANMSMGMHCLELARKSGLKKFV